MADQPSDDSLHPSLARIERAIERIENAACARVQATQSLTRRHGLLRQRMTEALAALDAVIAQQEAHGREDA